MVIDRRPLRRSGTNRRRPLTLPTHLLRQMARRICQNSSEWVDDTNRTLKNDLEIKSLELMVATAPLNHIRANSMTWAIFMRGFEVGRYLMQMGSDLPRTSGQIIPSSLEVEPSSAEMVSPVTEEYIAEPVEMEVEPSSAEVVPSVEEAV